MYEIKVRVKTSQTGRDGKLSLYGAFQMMQDCSELWAESEPKFVEYIKARGMAQLLASREVEVRRVPDFGERLSVRTSVWDCKPLYGFRNTMIVDEAGEICYATWSTGAFVSLETGRLAPLGEEVLRDCTYDPRYEGMTYGERRIRIPSAEPVGTPLKINVMRNDIDYNGHVNNAHYIRWATEALDGDCSPRHIRIEYKKALKQGDCAMVERRDERGRTVVVISDPADGRPAAVVEFEGETNDEKQ